jgi:hypothetical protein
MYARYRMSPERPPVATVSIVSCGALAYQLVLMRLLAVVHWHHFAALVISLALLGYGASGTWIALFPRAGTRGYDTFLPLAAAGFCISAISSTRAALDVPFNALDLLWDPVQLGFLVLLVGFMAVPFFFSGCVIGLTLSRFGRRIPGIYAADLLGAGLGSLAALAALYRLDPLEAGGAVALLGACGAVASRLERPGRTATLAAAAALAAAILAVVFPGQGLLERISPYKPLAQALETPGTGVVREATSPLGWIAVARSAEVPFRLVPGAALASPSPVPDQLAVFTDGEGPDALTAFDGDAQALAFLDDTTTAMAFHLAGPGPRRVLLPLAGTGMTALLSRYHGAADVTALEHDPRRSRLVTRTFADRAGWGFLSETTRYRTRTLRGHLAAGNPPYDLILFPPVGAGTAPGARSLSEDYDLTVEAVRACLRNLAPGGLLSLSWWIRLPPRDGLRLADTVLTALRLEGRSHPGDGLAVVRSWKTGTLVVRKGGLAPGDPAAVRRFCRERGFDPVFIPGIEPGEVNRRTVLRTPAYHEGVTALAGSGREAFLDRYKFDVGAVTDDRPYAHFYVRWKGFWELLAGGQAGGLEVLEWAYPMAVASVGLATLMGGMLLLLPLALRRPAFSGALGAGRRPLVYFAGIGVGFIVLEIVFVQMATRCLHAPVPAAASVLAGCLVFAGLGSRFAARLREMRIPGRAREAWAAAGILGGAAAGYGLLRFLADHAADAPLSLRVAMVVGSIAPMAFAMGIPFALGLSRLADRRPSWVPLAWSVNGCASVVGAVAAPLLSLHLGFAGAAAAAGACYLVSAASGPVPR